MEAEHTNDSPTLISADYLSLPPRFAKASLKWYRLSQLVRQPSSESLTIFGDNQIHMNHILQGELNDCSLLSALITLSLTRCIKQNSSFNPFPQDDTNLFMYLARIERLFVNPQVNSTGTYTVKLCHYGEWVEITINDTIPIVINENKEYEWLISQPYQQSIWVCLIEKAAASCRSSGYEGIEMWSLREAFYELTGSPCQYYEICDITDSELFEILHGALENRYCVTCGSMQIKNNMPSHAYAIVGMCNGAVSIVNPQGRQYKQSNKSDEQSCENNDHCYADGRSTISLSEMRKVFRDICVCYVHDGYVSDSIKANIMQSNRFEYFKIIVHTEGQYYLQVYQNGLRESDDPIQITWLLGKSSYSEQQLVNCSFIDGAQEATKQSYTSGIQGRVLEVGEYILAVKIEDLSYVKSVVIANYGEYHVGIEQVGQCDRFVEQLAINHARYVNTHNIQQRLIKRKDFPCQKLCISIGQMTEGYIYVAVWREKGDMSCTESIKYKFSVKNMAGLKLKKNKYTLENDKKVEFTLRADSCNVAVFRCKDSSKIESFDLEQEYSFY